MVALMTDAVTGKPTGIHRTYLDYAGAERERRMLDRKGCIRLSHDDEVTLGLGVTEGIEDGLAVLLTGWSPVWAAADAGAMARFPVLGGIECLTIFGDADAAGGRAANTCALRWRGARRSVEVLLADGGSRLRTLLTPTSQERTSAVRLTALGGRTESRGSSARR